MQAQWLLGRRRVSEASNSAPNANVTFYSVGPKMPKPLRKSKPHVNSAGRDAADARAAQDDEIPATKGWKANPTAYVSFAACSCVYQALMSQQLNGGNPGHRHAL